MARWEAHLAELAAGQHGVVSTAQLAELGMSRSTVLRRCARGSLVAVQPGVVRHAAHPDTWHGRLLAACLSTGGIASHRSAAVLWRADSIRSRVVEVTVAKDGASPRPGVLLHQTTQLDLADRTTIGGIPVTGPARTVLDLAAVVRLHLLESAVDDLIRQRRTTWPELHAALLRHSVQGRDGCGGLRALLAQRYGDGDIPLSNWSRLAARQLVGGGLPPPTLEYRVFGPSGHLVAQVDLAYPDERIAIELQSKRWHLNARNFETDPARWNQLTRLGWQVYPFTWSFLMTESSEACRIVRDALRLAHARSGDEASQK